MKKIFFILGVLLSLGMFCACSSDDEVIDENDGVAVVMMIFLLLEMGKTRLEVLEMKMTKVRIVK